MMRKLLIILCCGLLTFYTSNAGAQTDKRVRWYVKGGINFIGDFQTASYETSRLMDSPEGVIPYNALESASDDKSSMNTPFVVPGLPVGGIYISFPFLLTTGLEYQPVTTRTVYKSADAGTFQDYYIKEYNTIHSVAIPLFLDLRRKTRVFSFYAGGRIHFNIAGSQLQKSSWNDEVVLKRSLSAKDKEFDLISTSLVGGINISFVNIELAYYPTSSMNGSYVNDVFERPYQAMDQQPVLKLSTSIILGGKKKY
ncbi:hypothetical protein V6R21_09910 [Limibacter armeniacum]|uniref:hypothetical protein n=1 Tax=Limibacter armeniacum TaxID=466084 RepID=UPI002FE504C9